eukprot:jgi/Ulvmu1/11286/UM074_0001.1
MCRPALLHWSELLLMSHCVWRPEGVLRQATCGHSTPQRGRACRQRDFDINLKATDASGAPQAQPSFAVRLSIDTLTGETCETVLTEDWSLDFPTVPAASIGRSTPYAYMGGTPIGKTSTDLVSILMSAVVKIDLAAEEGNGVVAVIEHAAGLVGGEFSFVPRRGAVDADDGYLVGYATHATTLLSYCLVYDAKTMASTPVAKVQLPQRVPAGFTVCGSRRRSSRSSLRPLPRPPS